MFRSIKNLQISQNIYKLFINQINKRYQSVANPLLETNIPISQGHIKGAITNKLEFIRPETHTPIPVYQVLDPDGYIKDINSIPDVSR